jgi:hypothetical protein
MMTDKDPVINDSIELSPLHELKSRYAPIPRPYVDVVRKKYGVEIKRVRFYS